MDFRGGRHRITAEKRVIIGTIADDSMIPTLTEFFRGGICLIWPCWNVCGLQSLEISMY